MSSIKKLFNTAFVYAIAALAGGVFYREFTKFNGFTDRTALSALHPHLLIMGALVFLLLLLFEKQFHITQHKKFKTFYLLYNIGLPYTVLCFLWHGIEQVLGVDSGAMRSGIAGIGHIIFALGIIWMFLLIGSCLKTEENANQTTEAAKKIH